MKIHAITAKVKNRKERKTSIIDSLSYTVIDRLPARQALFLAALHARKGANLAD